MASSVGQFNMADHRILVEGCGQEAFQAAWLLTGEFPADQGDPTTGGSTEQAWWRVRSAGAAAPVRVHPQPRGFVEMQAPQHLGAHHLHLSIGLDQQARVPGQGANAC